MNPQELAKPTNISWQLFKRNWKNVVRGSIKYAIRHPITALRIFIPRLRYCCLKNCVKTPIKTPEGFLLRTNMELLVYTQTFIEQNLYSKQFIKDFKKQINPYIIDVGANVGIVCQWLHTFNSTANFDAIEIWDYQVGRGKEFQNVSGINIKWFNNAASNCSGTLVEFNVGEQISIQKLYRTEQVLNATTLAIDDLTHKGGIVPFAIKIDTDGSNTQVLEGATETLAKTKWLLIEDEAGVKEWITKFAPGFRLVNQSSPDDLLYLNGLLM